MVDAEYPVIAQSGHSEDARLDTLPITASTGMVLLVYLLLSRRAFRRKTAVELALMSLLGPILATMCHPSGC